MSPQPEPEPTSGRPTAAPFLGALAIVLLALIVMGLTKLFLAGDGSPEQQITRAAVAQNDALQRRDYAAFRTYTCAAQHSTEADVLAQQEDSVGKRGERYLDEVKDVAIDGDRATAKVVYHFDKNPDAKTEAAITFAREDGAWKVCSPGPR
ncbi:lumazine-binding domain protein [Mycolicibacterium hassiacum DSM 44199]|uniref:Lumazine-binding domain protein n=1 Tax=Mycolicibacterium hassiacum (strain DSM 44199 / CIP 105218 / JCM 12690 / 3849) TaxID=1122247 RepID=K5BH79_MYCHD|nr:hypothetical protein [Mycolicibacterium hassiacum]EKF25442.1 lumazine-binding domain protein [Mycolicibacterium hassiacum DSM 44199]MBX5488366.1 lumazine-binding protein [Mycolicibacterium hassiacum]MDA4086152.1 lumazine-binding domain protein [Mycolicibacterium hassiacum DSM 44199]PZN12907.1 MAG: lumazine-binding protein [Mycolicibacterium hassiacum]VCT92969.1 hypothetical protein MHAS_04707 [Mycolicibacterium hassiacum DSM 44199]